MGIVSGWVGTAQGQLDGVAETMFGDVVNAAGTTISAMATLAIVFLGINLVMQYRPMAAGYVLTSVIKLVLIVWIGLKWGQFNQITGAIISGMNSLAGVMLSGVGAGGSLETAVDNLLSQISNAANSALEPLNWMTGAFLSVTIAIALGVIAAIIALALIFVAVALTLYLGIAPIFIAFSMFETTRDLFTRWVQGVISYALYPVVLAGVLGGMVRVVNAYMSSLSTNDASTSIAGFIPFLSILFIMFFVIILIPMIVSGLSGMMQFSGPLSPVIRTMANLTAANRGIAAAMSKMPSTARPNAGGQSAANNSKPAPTVAPAAKIAARNAKYK